MVFGDWERIEGACNAWEIWHYRKANNQPPAIELALGHIIVFLFKTKWKFYDLLCIIFKIICGVSEGSISWTSFSVLIIFIAILQISWK